jgi:hypothetical protein
MLKTVSKVGLVAAALVVLPGCLEVALVQALQSDDEAPEAVADSRRDFDEGDGDVGLPDDYYDDDYGIETTLDVRSASLAGDMGDIRGFADDDATHSGYDYGNYASIQVNATAPEGAAMVILEIEGGLTNEALVDGAHFRFRSYDYPETGLYMYAIGCSGPEEGNWLFDAQAEDIVVDVTETIEGTTVLDFVATYAGGQTVVGSAELGALRQ